jgi:hypothetical protein
MKRPVSASSLSCSIIEAVAAKSQLCVGGPGKSVVTVIRTDVMVKGESGYKMYDNC